MLSVVTLIVIMLNVVMLGVLAPLKSYENVILKTVLRVLKETRKGSQLAAFPFQTNFFSLYPLKAIKTAQYKVPRHSA